MPESYYATADELRESLVVDDQVLDDDAATKLLIEAEDLIDERLGNWPINPDSGRKIDVADDAIEPWRLRKLAEATIEVATVIFGDPDVARRQRARFSSGDVSVNGFYGPAYGERGMALLNQSGLVVNRARMAGGPGRRRRRYGGYRDPLC